MSVDLAVRYVCDQVELGEGNPPFHLGDAMEATDLLFPMLEMFQSDLGRKVNALPYDKAGEAEVDAALESLAQAPEVGVEMRSTKAARVLLERVKQALITLGANAAANEPVLIPSRSLEKGHRHTATALLWLHQMELPFEPGTVLPPKRQRH